MEIVAATALLASGVIGAVGASQAGEAQKSAAKFESQVLQQQAQREREVAAASERDFRKQQSAFLARRRAAMGASGVELGEGSPLLSFGDFASEVELQAQRIREGGQLSATRLEQQAELTRRAGRSAQQRGRFRAGASLLTGAGQAFGALG